MVTKEYSEALVEVLEIINCLDEQERKKIPDEVIKYYEDNKSETYKPVLAINSDDISHAILKNKTREILAGLYIDYLCDNEEEKNQYIKDLRKTEYGYEEAKKSQYEQNPIYAQELAAFDTAKKAENTNEYVVESNSNSSADTDVTANSPIEDNKALVKHNSQNIFVRIWLKLKSFFKKNI